MLFVASSTVWDMHATVRIEANPYSMTSAVPTALQYGVGTLMNAPLVDADGYSYLVVDDQGEIQPVRVTELDPPSPNGIHLGSFM